MKKIAFYPTPIEIVDIMINSSSVNNNNLDILEPGFGEGAFFNEIIQNHSFNSLTGIEIDQNFYISQKNIISSIDNQNINIFNDDFLNFDFKKKFDLIIGNPPYINSDNLDDSIKNKITELTGSGEGNIYYAFIFRSIELLKENGELIFILPYDFFFNTYAQKLREALSNNGEFEFIIDLGDLNIFKNASPDTIIFKWIKREKKQLNNIEIFSYFGQGNFKEIIPYLKDVLQNKEKNKYFSHFILNRLESSYQHIWSLSNFIEFKNTEPLKNKANVGVGIVSGSEDIFNIKNVDQFFFNDFEKEFCIKKFLKSKNLKKMSIYDIEENNYIFIPDFFKKEEDLKTKCPNVYSYLKNSFERLSNRYIPKNKQWFNYLAIRNLNLMDKHLNSYKIIVPSLTRKDNEWFSITNLPYYVSGDCLIIVGKNEYYTFLLFAILNSDYFNSFYKSTGPKKGKRIVFHQRVLMNTSIPVFDKIINDKLVQSVSNMIKSSHFDFSEINKIINDIISKK